MKKFLIAFFTFCTFCISNAQQTKELHFEPKGIKKYQIVLKSNKMEWTYKIECHYTNKGELINLAAVITEIAYKDGSSIEKGMNSDLQRFVGDTITAVFDKNGYAAQTEPGKRLFNPELLVAELPKQKIKEGDTWEGRKSASPDIVFKSIATKYTCKKVNAEDAVIDVDMTFEKDKEEMKSLTKFYKGFYVINNDGTVKNAEFDITGFTGFSNLNGQLTITEIQ